MLKPPASTMPGMTDTLDFVKNLWGSMHLPGSGIPGMSGIAGPTLSTDELDKRIADLKAVESWLNMNIAMLRGTIQALEVQRGTLAAMKSMGASMAEAMRQSGVSSDKMAAMPFAAFFAPPAPPAAGKPSSPAPATTTDAGTAQPGATTSAAADADAAGAGGAAAMGMPAAMAWWNLLQNQFQQAVSTAMNSAASAAPNTPAAATAGDGGQSAQSSNQPPAPHAAPDAGVSDGGDGGNGGNGSSKTRTPRSRADKG